MRNLLILLITGALLAACGPGPAATIPATTVTPSAVPATERPGITVTATVTASAIPTRPTILRTSRPTATIVPDIYDLATPTIRPSRANGTPTEVITSARNALVDHLGRAVNTLTLTTVQQQTWNDSALGCPDPSQGYAQVIVPGYRLVFSDGERQYAIHTSETASPLILCQNGQPERLGRLELPE